VPPPRRPVKRHTSARGPAPLGRRVRAQLADPVRQLQLSMAVLALLLVVGTVGYHLLEDMRWLDAAYMTVITVATVGYGEVEPLTSGAGVHHGADRAGGGRGRLGGQPRGGGDAGADAVAISVQRRRMRQSLESLRDHYVICGHGRLGTRIERDLMARGEPFVVVDWSAVAGGDLPQRGIPHLIGDATQDDVLRNAGVHRARGLVAALDSDASNVLAVLTARELNAKLLMVARANSEASESKLRRAGADRVVTPDAIGGHRLALALLRPAVHDLFNEIFSASGWRSRWTWGRSPFPRTRRSRGRRWPGATCGACAT
jgi:voltage-gated potassium channel